MKTIKYVFSLIISLLFYSCGVIRCNAFPDNLTGWTPYKTNDILIFTSGIDTIKFNVKESSKTEASTISANCDCLCSNPIAEFITDTCSQGIVLSAICNTNPAELQYSFAASKYIDKLSFNYLIHVNADSIVYNLNTTQISNVVAIENKSGGLVKKIFLHKGMGLIGFVDKNNNEYKLVVN